MYRITGINLKSMPLGESDRLLTILTPERGLLRVVAGGSRKAKSKFGGRTGLFVLNELMIKPGKSLDRIHHAETLASYPGLSRHFGLLTASQYLAEIALNQALEDSPQSDLFNLLTEHLQRLEQLPAAAPIGEVLAHLCQGIFHLLALGGIAPPSSPLLPLSNPPSSPTPTTSTPPSDLAFVLGESSPPLNYKSNGNKSNSSDSPQASMKTETMKPLPTKPPSPRPQTAISTVINWPYYNNSPNLTSPPLAPPQRLPGLPSSRFCESTHNIIWDV